MVSGRGGGIVSTRAVGTPSGTGSGGGSVRHWKGCESRGGRAGGHAAGREGARAGRRAGCARVNSECQIVRGNWRPVRTGATKDVAMATGLHLHLHLHLADVACDGRIGIGEFGEDGVE